MAMSSGFVGAPEPFDHLERSRLEIVHATFLTLCEGRQINNDQKKHLLLMDAPTYNLASLAALTELGDLTYKDVVDKQEAHFKPKSIITVEHFQFYKRNQESWEKMADYLAELG